MGSGKPGGKQRIRPRRPSTIPKGPRSGPKYYSINGIWALKPYYLGPWTLRECHKTVALISFAYWKKHHCRNPTLRHTKCSRGKVARALLFFRDRTGCRILILGLELRHPAQIAIFGVQMEMSQKGGHASIYGAFPTGRGLFPGDRKPPNCWDLRILVETCPPVFKFES